VKRVVTIASYVWNGSQHDNGKNIHRNTLQLLRHSRVTTRTIVAERLSGRRSVCERFHVLEAPLSLRSGADLRFACFFLVNQIIQRRHEETKSKSTRTIWCLSLCGVSLYRTEVVGGRLFSKFFTNRHYLTRKGAQARPYFASTSIPCQDNRPEVKALEAYPNVSIGASAILQAIRLNPHSSSLGFLKNIRIIPSTVESSRPISCRNTNIYPCYDRHVQY